MNVLLLDGLSLKEVILLAVCRTWGGDQMGKCFSHPASRGISDVKGVESIREGGLEHVHRLPF